MQTLFHTTVHILRKAFPPQRRALAAWTGGALLLVFLSVTVYAAVREEQPSVLVQTGYSDAADADMGSGNTLIQPELLSGSSSTMLLGSVLSNDTANIYPRRDGIIEDIYVDIGDHIEKNQVIALLLPQGVEGQSAAMIAEQGARRDQAASELSSAKIVAEQMVSNAVQQVLEKETELTVAKREQQAVLKRFAELDANVSQMNEQALTAVRSARQLIEQILTGSNSRSGEDIHEEDIRRQLGLLNTQIRYTIAPQFTELDSLEQQMLSAEEHERAKFLEQIIDVADTALSTTVSLLGATPSVPNAQPGLFTQEEIAALTQSVFGAQQNLFMAKEKFQNARIALETLSSSEPELALAYRTESVEGAMSNSVRMLEAQLGTVRDSVRLTEANQQQMAERQRSMLSVADAMLQSEVAQSGHRQIRSPFSGTVSKRFIEVGQIVMSSMPTFELVDVSTSLAKKAKQEIEFGLPEDLMGTLLMGEELFFTLASDSGTPHRATVSRVSPQVDSESRTITVRARVEDDVALPNNASVRVHIERRALPVYRLPSYAVKRMGGRNVIWTQNPDGGQPLSISVDVLSEDGEFAEVTGDLSPETLVLPNPPEFLINDDSPNPS